MTGMQRRLRRLEERFRGPVENEWARRVTARLEAARRRSGVPPPPAERLAQIRGMSIVEILQGGQATDASRQLLPCRADSHFPFRRAADI
jgi:hypothetical protein